MIKYVWTYVLVSILTVMVSGCVLDGDEDLPKNESESYKKTATSNDPLANQPRPIPVRSRRRAAEAPASSEPNSSPPPIPVM